MFKLKITIENTNREEDGYIGTIDTTRIYETKDELENAVTTPETLSDAAYDLFTLAEANNYLEDVEDDGDTYNGDTDNDINA